MVKWEGIRTKILLESSALLSVIIQLHNLELQILANQLIFFYHGLAFESQYVLKFTIMITALYFLRV